MVRLARKNLVPVLIGVLAFLAALIALAPASILMRMAAAKLPAFSSTGAAGTVWRGALRDVSANGVYYGDIAYRVDPLSLLSAFPKIRLSARGGAVDGAGVIRVGLHGRVVVADAELAADLAPFAQRGIMGEPVSGAARLTIAALDLSPRGCRRAMGEVWTDVLSGPARRFDGAGFDMRGDIACDGDDFVAALAGAGEEGAAQLSLRVRPDLTYVIDAEARPVQDQVAVALRFFGFEDQGGALVYGSAGVLTGAGS